MYSNLLKVITGKNIYYMQVFYYTQIYPGRMWLDFGFVVCKLADIGDVFCTLCILLHVYVVVGI